VLLGAFGQLSVDHGRTSAHGVLDASGLVGHVAAGGEVDLHAVAVPAGHADRQLCPYRKHALISHQEHEAWEVLVACQGQLRVAPSGHVVGIAIDVALSLASVRGCDLAVLSELLPAAEVGLVEALSMDRGRGDGF
jgi:hypothetical protein